LRAKDRSPGLKVVWVDGISEKEWRIGWALGECGWELRVVKRTDKEKGFKVLPKRWVVERTFGWLGRYLRLSKEYERWPETREVMI
jgi:putative transposase